MNIKEFCGKCYFDEGSGIVLRENGQMLTEVRGWAAIQNAFKTEAPKVAAGFQNGLGRFIASAINEKIERDFKNDLP